MTYEKAHRIAKKRSIKADGAGRDIYIISEDGEYDVTDDYGMDTYWAGAEITAHYFGGECCDSY